MSATEHVAKVPEEISSVCSTGLLPHILTGSLLQILRHHFADPSNIVLGGLRDNVWTDDVGTTKIRIEAGYNWTPKEGDQLPAALVNRGALTTQRDIIGNTANGAPSLDGYEEDSYMVSFSGSHSILCVAHTGSEAELLGAEVGFELLEFGQIIRREFGFGSYDLGSIGEVSKYQDADFAWVVPVTVKYAFSHGWRVLRERPTWMSIGLNTAAQGD